MVSVTSFGEGASLITIEKGRWSASVSDYGATLVRLCCPGKDGRIRNIVQGYDSVEGYRNGGNYFGCTVGRYANRIKGGRFSIGGTEYQVQKNEGNNTLHSADVNFGHRMWKYEIGDDWVRFTIESPDMEGGYPGNVVCSLKYTLTFDGKLVLNYEGTTDMPTYLNFTNHSYFNISDSRKILDCILTVDADEYVAVDDENIPVSISSVEGTPFDFRSPKKVGRDIGQLPNGYDHCYVLKKGIGLKRAASLYCEDTGIVLNTFTDLPGIQIYTGAYIDQATDSPRPYEAMCFETEFYPDMMNMESRDECLFTADRKLETTTVWEMGLRK